MSEKSVITLDYAAHWYLPSGKPYHTVIAKSGKERATNLTDARKEGAFRSVTSVQKFAARPQLEIWSKNELLDAIREIPFDPETDDQEKYIAKLIRRHDAEKEHGARRGNVLHATFEAFVNGGPIKSRLRKFVEAVQAALTPYGINLQEGIAESSFFNHRGFGGTIDWHNCEPDAADNYYILDYKGKRKIEDDKELAYDNHAQQLAAYRYVLLQPGATCLNVFIDEQAKVVVHQWEEPVLRRELRKFFALLDYVNIHDRRNMKDIPESKIRYKKRTL